MKISTRYQARGMVRIVRGTIMGILARVRANRILGARGRLEKFTGTVQCRIGKAQGAIGL